ncbi:RagB/SusD family nutrient uptake outer membrane protein [Capnocytophaga canimorsus]|uniref:RagB/SusD family nutrient uptake outer membrane protein n=1 Tax=Capnocytophaga canimorsus TaxID=28188 RepID=UPI001AD3AD1D|nr:RagB/SusD family nutrient uptake outer membrane protein [Capnocytophaga canimorsus]GIM58618.1 membrane protein [Capnocytophaga canimorsus]
MKRIFFIIALSVTAISCDKFLDIEPKGKVIPQSPEEFRQLLNSGYRSVPTYKSDVAFRTDELKANENSDDFAQYKNIYIWEDVITDLQTKTFPYEAFYQSIFYANETLISGAKRMPESSEKQQILAEAYALRAYNHFNLVNLYAKPYNINTASTDNGVPLALTVDLEKEFPKASVEKVYEQILSDIAQSEQLMQVDQQEKGLNYRFSKASLYAFASRVYLYMGAYEKSIAFADKSLAINDAIIDLNQKQQMPSAFDGEESLLALENPFTNQLQNASFAADEFVDLYDTNKDWRFALYFSENSGKHLVQKAGRDQYKCSFRTAEQYLNKAEALAILGDENKARQTLLILLKKRYKTADFPTIEAQIQALTSTDLIAEIRNERARELAFEGHRWFDLRRANQKEIIHTFQGKTYTLKANDPRYTLPFPKEAIENNPKL